MVLKSFQSTDVTKTADLKILFQYFSFCSTWIFLVLVKFVDELYVHLSYLYGKYCYFFTMCIFYARFEGSNDF